MKRKQPKWDQATFKTKKAEDIYDVNVEKLFPLFCPVREFDYMRYWTCTMRFSISGYA